MGLLDSFFANRKQMLYSHPEGERVQTSGVSDKTARIAISYREKMERINKEWYDYLEQKYLLLSEELRFFESALTALSGNLSGVMRDMGDCILQKTYTADYLTKRMEKNEGHIEQYYIKDDHEALISKDFWNATQKEIARRRDYMTQHGLRSMGRYTDSQPFSNRVFCGMCGNVFWRRTLTRLNGSFKVWMCGKRYQEKGVRGCNSESLKEADLHRTFIMAWNAILENRTEFLPKWKEQSQSDNPLTAFRARQFIKATESAEPMRMLDCALVSMVFDHCTVEPLGIINFYFLDGTQLGIEYKD